MGLEFAELMMTVEETFDIEIPETVAVDTVGELYDEILPLIKAGTTDMPTDTIWETYISIITTQFELPKFGITANTRWDELGM